MPVKFQRRCPDASYACHRSALRWETQALKQVRSFVVPWFDMLQSYAPNTVRMAESAEDLKIVKTLALYVDGQFYLHTFDEPTVTFGSIFKKTGGASLEFDSLKGWKVVQAAAAGYESQKHLLKGAGTKDDPHIARRITGAICTFMLKRVCVLFCSVF